MGYYIETPENLQKAKQLIELHGAEISLLPKFDKTGKNITICVVENGFFDAAGICYDETEFQDFQYPDGRPRKWLTLPREKVIELCPTVESLLTKG